MKTETIRLEPTRFSRIRFETKPKSEDAPTRTVFLSPYDTPEAVVVGESDSHYWLTIRYMFEEERSSQREEIGTSGCAILLDAETGRVTGLTIDKASSHGKRLSEMLKQLAQQVQVPDENFIPGGKERSMQFRRAVLPIVLNETAIGLAAR